MTPAEKKLIEDMKKLVKLHEDKDHVSKSLPKMEFIYNASMDTKFGNAATNPINEITKRYGARITSGTGYK